MKNRPVLIERLKLDEGFSRTPYLCPAGKTTVGYGRNLDDKGVSKIEAEYLLVRDVEEVERDLKKIFPDFSKLPEQVQHVCANMRFQLGPHRFRKFKKFIAAVKAWDWKDAIAEMMDSRWYGQTFNRANRLVDMMGELQ